MTSDRQRRLEALLPPGAVTEPLPLTLDADTFTPRLLALLSNALVWRESHELRRRFRLGTNDWRVLAALAVRPGMTSGDVAEYVGMNKAVVSKSVQTLLHRRMLVQIDGPRGSRPMYLTPAGADMHDAMLPISLRGQEIILADMSPKDVALLNSLLQRLLSKTGDLQQFDDEASIGATSGRAGMDDAP